MKNLVILFLSCICFVDCASSSVHTNKIDNSLSFEKGEKDEYDLVVYDLGYETYLMTIAQPMDFYSELYYKTKNQRYVDIWNYRVSQPFQYDPDLYSLRIEYDPTVEYGKLLEYKLFNFFQFFEWKYKVSLDFGR